MKQPNVLTAALAAREKSCTREAIYAALDRGDLNGTRMGGTRLVFVDKTYRNWQIQETGGRLHKSYKKKEAD